MAFKRNVFINCPFDTNYHTLLKPLLFTIRKIGFTPRIALERFDSGEARFDKIKELLLESKYSIHDLSRIKSVNEEEYFRLNMPFELGVDFGCKLYHPNNKYRSNRFLLMEGEQYSVQKGLSDFSFADCKCHNNNSEQIVTLVRNWFIETGILNLPPPSKIWDEYNIFYSELYLRKKPEGYSRKDIVELPIPEFIQFIDEVI
ncbi:MAG: hypothetical protein JWN78_1907 [Bacteroidota bacterium]|nr:hypothetical protein [Bacteroidota bacterium]